MFPPVTPLVLRLILINVGVYLVVNLFGAALPFDPYRTLALWYPGSENFFPVQVISHVFMHSDYSIRHLLFNMLMLFFVGPPVEERLGPKNFFILYFGAAMGSMLLHLGMTWWEISEARAGLEAFLATPDAETFFQAFKGEDMNYPYRNSRGSLSMSTYVASIYNDLSLGGVTASEHNAARDALAYHLDHLRNTPMLGASGAIFGVAAAFLFFYPHRKVQLLFIPVPMPAWVLIGGYILYDVVQGFRSVPGDNVAHFAHLGGAITGFILAYVFSKQPPKWMKRIN